MPDGVSMQPARHGRRLDVSSGAATQIQVKSSQAYYSPLKSVGLDDASGFGERSSIQMSAFHVRATIAHLFVRRARSPRSLPLLLWRPLYDATERMSCH